MHTHTSSSHRTKEHRLLHKQESGRHDWHEQKEHQIQTGKGKPGYRSLNDMRGATERLADKLTTVKAGFFERLNHFDFSGKGIRNRKQEELIIRMAKKKIEETSNLSIGWVQGIFRRGKRAAYLQTLTLNANMIRENLARHYEVLYGRSQEREERLRSLSGFVRRGGKPVIKASKQVLETRMNLEKMGEKYNKKIQKEGEPRELVERRAAIQALRQELVEDLKIVPPEDFDRNVANAAKGDTWLLTLINSQKSLSKDHRQCLIAAVQRLRPGWLFNRSASWQGALDSAKDPNIGGLDGRLAFLRKEGLGKYVKFSNGIGGLKPFTATVISQDPDDPSMIMVRNTSDGSLATLDLEAKIVTKTGNDGEPHDYFMRKDGQPPFSIQFSLN